MLCVVVFFLMQFVFIYSYCSHFYVIHLLGKGIHIKVEKTFSIKKKSYIDF